MRKIIDIMFIDERINKTTNKPYFITTAQLDDGSEAEGYGKEFRIDDKVECFFHYGKIKMRKGRHENN